MNQRLFVFAGGDFGSYRITQQRLLCGDDLPATARLSVAAAGGALGTGVRWSLSGVVSNERYVTRPERQALVSRQAALGRPEARYGAFIPIKKSEAWWALPQDERRAILEEQSHHIRIGLRYLPAIARRLHHCRDLGSDAPFDFLTWFDFSESDVQRFDDLLAELRGTVEWQYVEREVEIRVERGED